MKIKQIVDKEGNLHILRFYNKGERYEIKKRNKAFCDAQHNQDLLLMRAFIKKRADIAYNQAYKKERYQDPEIRKKIIDYQSEYQKRPEVKAYYKAYYQRPEVKQRMKEYSKEYNQRPEMKAYRKAYYHSHKKPISNLQHT